MLCINELKLSLDDDENKLKELIAKKLKVSPNKILNYKIIKKSLDARKDLYYSYSVLVDVEHPDRYLKIKNVSSHHETNLKTITIKTSIRPIIIGYGPSGIFSCLRLVEAGIKPIVFEKGKRIKDREKDVEAFFNNGILNENSNVQFGEGGAGSFSDAKLTTRIKDPFIDYILNTFIRFGARKEIYYSNHSHIGTDEIRIIITKITDYLVSQGVEFHFDEAVRQVLIKDGKAYGVKTDKNDYYSNYILLGIGHSAYDLICQLNKDNVYIEKKDLAIGFRVEHPQSLIDDVQYHHIKHPKLEPSEYFLRYKDEKGVYSFCMCPGGFVIPSNSEKNTICTNGMSYASRANNLANSAILIQVNKEEFGEDNLSGFDYLHNLERKAYSISNSYKALAMNIKDYINNDLNELIFKSSYPLKTTLYNFNNFFTSEQNQIFKKALIDFDSKIPGFIEKGIMVGPETRSSSPVRITRNEALESINTKGLYPMGEGAGYGGGIMSCSLDGIRIANKIIETIK